MQTLLMLLMFLVAVFLILLVLVQRGKGGGLVGALGGPGGQSAFGAKASDVFTRFTIWVAVFWIVLCTFSVRYLRGGGASGLPENLGGSAPVSEPVQPALKEGRPAETPSGPAAGPPPAPAETSD